MTTYNIDSCSLGQVITDTAGTLSIGMHTDTGYTVMNTGSFYVYLYLPNQNTNFTLTADLGPGAISQNTTAMIQNGGGSSVLSMYLGADTSQTASGMSGTGLITRVIVDPTYAWYIKRNSSTVGYIHRPLLLVNGYNIYQVSGAVAGGSDTLLGTLYNRTGSFNAVAPYSPLLAGATGNIASISQINPPAAGINTYSFSLNLTGSSYPTGTIPGVWPYYNDEPPGYLLISVVAQPDATHYRSYAGFTLTWSPQSTPVVATTPTPTYNFNFGTLKKYNEGYGIKEESREFHSNFHHYFDRNNNFNCYVSFNFIEMLKTNSTDPKIYDDPNFASEINKLLKYNFYLQNEDSSLDRIDDVNLVNLFKDKNVTTFYLTKKAKNIVGNKLVRCLISFQDGFYDYIANSISEEDNNNIIPSATNYQNKIFIREIKNILDKKFINQFSPSSITKTFEFASDYISFGEGEIKISNLHDIYSPIISEAVYSNYIQVKEREKQATYNGSVPIPSYFKNNKLSDLKFNLKDKVGSIENYLDLSLSLLNDSKNRLNYKQTDYNESIFLEEAGNRNYVRQEIPDFDIIGSMQSTGCDNQIFIGSNAREFNDSDILYMCAFLNNYDIVEMNDYWLDNIKLLPVYLLEIITKYKVFYLERMDTNSMHEYWNPLTKDTLENLESGKYLCMISTDKMYINDSLIENYFILEK